MTHQTLFALAFGPALLAAVIGLLGDMLSQRAAGRIAAAVLLSTAGIVSIAAGWGLEAELVHDTFMTGRGYSTVVGVVLLLAGVSLLGSTDRHGSVPGLVALAAGGAALAATSADLVATLVSLEIAAMSGYALVSSARTRRADEASIKYFVQGAVATGLFVLGLAVLVGGIAGVGSIALIVTAIGQLQQSTPALLGVAAVVSALAFKAGAAPFHSWAPDAYENAPAPVAGFLSGAVKLGMIAALAIFAISAFGAGASRTLPLGLVGSDVIGIVGALALLSIVIGSTVALNTASYTRMLGYAGVAQVGYALIAIAALSPDTAILFGTTYAVGTTGAFVAAAAVARIMPEWDGGIAGLAGLGHRAPKLAAAITVLLMSLAGIPPLFGFWGKFRAFAAAIDFAVKVAPAEWGAVPAVWLAVLAAAGIVGSIVSLGYYGAVIRAIYFGEEAAGAVSPEGLAGGTPSSGAPGAVVVALAVAVLVLGIAPVVLGNPTAFAGFLLG